MLGGEVSDGTNEERNASMVILHPDRAEASWNAASLLMMLWEAHRRVDSAQQVKPTPDLHCGCGRLDAGRGPRVWGSGFIELDVTGLRAQPASFAFFLYRAHDMVLFGSLGDILNVIRVRQRELHTLHYQLSL